MAHIPDGFLSPPVAAATLTAAGVLAVYSGRRVRRELDEHVAPALGLATAAVFAAQLANFPVVAGTSGHLLGGTVVAVLFGPWAAYLVMLAVLVGQALLFADGGVTALGANAVNIAGIGAILGYALYRLFSALLGTTPRARSLAAVAAAYPCTVLTGIAAGLEIGVSGTAPTDLAISAMALVYAVIGIAEAGITGLVVSSVAARRPDLLDAGRSIEGPVTRPAVLVALGGAAIVAGLASLAASGAPDGLERVAVDLGFSESALEILASPFAGYRAWLPGAAGTAMAGVLGIAFLFSGATAVTRGALTTLHRNLARKR